jgi:hypothetical protein
MSIPTPRRPPEGAHPTRQQLDELDTLIQHMLALPVSPGEADHPPSELSQNQPAGERGVSTPWTSSHSPPLPAPSPAPGFSGPGTSSMLGNGKGSESPPAGPAKPLTGHLTFLTTPLETPALSTSPPRVLAPKPSEEELKSSLSLKARIEKLALVVPELSPPPPGPVDRQGPADQSATALAPTPRAPAPEPGPERPPPSRINLEELAARVAGSSPPPPPGKERPSPESPPPSSPTQLVTRAGVPLLPALEYGGMPPLPKGPQPLPLVLKPLLWINQLFDVGTWLLGPPGRWLRGPRGRLFLGWTGLGLLAAAAAWAVLGWIGWIW